MTAITSQYNKTIARFEAFRESVQTQDQIDQAAIPGLRDSIEHAKASLDPHSDTYTEQVTKLTQAMEYLTTFLESDGSLSGRDVVRSSNESVSAASASVFAQADVSEILASKPFIIYPLSLERTRYNHGIALFLTDKVLKAIHDDPTGMTSAKLDALAEASVVETENFFSDPTRYTESWTNALHEAVVGSVNNCCIYPGRMENVAEKMFCGDSNRLFGRIIADQTLDLKKDFIKRFGVAFERGSLRPFFLFEFNKEGVPRLYASNNLDSIVKLLEDMSINEKYMIISVPAGSTFAV